MADIIKIHNGKIEIDSDDFLFRESFEGKDEQSRVLAGARKYLRDGVFKINNLTNKELLLLSFYVRQVLKEHNETKPKDMEIDREAAERWFQHVTGYYSSDFKVENEVAQAFTEDKKLVDMLRQKFNANDDTRSFEEI